MQTFRERVIQAIVDNENDDANREFWGVEVNTDEGADVSFWYARDDQLAYVIVSEGGLTTEAAERANAAVKKAERGTPEDAFLAAFVAIPCDWREMETPELDGYEVWDGFGLSWFGAFGVSPTVTPPADGSAREGSAE